MNNKKQNIIRQIVTWFEIENINSFVASSVSAAPFAHTVQLQ